MRKYVVMLIALGAMLMQSAQAGNILMITSGNPPNMTTNTGDAAVKARIEAMGHTVTLVGDTVCQTSDATGKDMVIVCEAVTSGNIGTKYKDVTIPVIFCEQANVDDFLSIVPDDTTLHGTVASQTQLVIANPSHPMAAGLTGTVTVQTAANTFGYGKPVGSFINIATIPGDATQSAIFGYEKGATMNGTFTAPARRVFFYVTGQTATTSTPEAWALFDAAFKWAYGPRLSVSSTALTFPSVNTDFNPSATSTANLNITNTGMAPLDFVTQAGEALKGITVSGAKYSVQSWAPPTTSPLAPGATLSITLKFAPGAGSWTPGGNNNYTGTLSIFTANPAVARTDIALGGLAVPVELSGFKAE